AFDQRQRADVLLHQARSMASVDVGVTQVRDAVIASRTDIRSLPCDRSVGLGLGKARPATPHTPAGANGHARAGPARRRRRSVGRPARAGTIGSQRLTTRYATTAKSAGASWMPTHASANGSSASTTPAPPSGRVR